MTPMPKDGDKAKSETEMADTGDSTDGAPAGSEGMRKRGGGADNASDGASNTNGSAASEGASQDHGHSHGHDHGSGAKKKRKPWYRAYL